MRTFVIVVAVIAVLLGLVMIVSPIARGLGFTVGALLGVVLVVAGGARLAIEARHGRGGELR